MGPPRISPKYPNVHLFISGRNPQRVEDALKSILEGEGRQAKVQSLILDITSADSISRAVDELKSELGDAPLDILMVSHPSFLLSGIGL